MRILNIYKLYKKAREAVYANVDKIEVSPSEILALLDFYHAANQRADNAEALIVKIAKANK